MRVWLEKYWPVLILFLVTTTGTASWLTVLRIIAKDIPKGYATPLAVGTVAFVLLAAVVLGRCADARCDAYYSKIFFSSLGNQEAAEEALTCLADRLSDAYEADEKLQTGKRVVVVDLPTDARAHNEDYLRRLRKNTRRAIQKEVDRRIAYTNHRFWGVAHLLAKWKQFPLPKSFKECRTKKPAA